MIKTLCKFAALIVFSFFILSCSEKGQEDAKTQERETTQTGQAEKLPHNKTLETKDEEASGSYQEALKAASILLEFETVNKKITLSLKAEENIKIEGAVPSEVPADGSLIEIFISKPVLAFLGKVEVLQIHDAEILKTASIKSLALKSLDLSFTGLKNIEFSDCPSLEKLILENNKKLENIDLSALPELKEISLRASSILDSVFSGKGADSNFLSVKKLNCAKTKIKNIELSQFPSLEYLDLSFCDLDSIDLTKSPELKSLYCENSNLKELDLSQNKKLIELNCRGNGLSDLALFQNKELKFLDCGKNGLSGLLINLNLNLQKLHCDSNSLEVLDLSALKELEEVYCYRNKIENLILGSNSNLKTVFCFENKISEKSMRSLFDSMEAGDGYNFKTIAVYAEKNPNLIYKSDIYFDNNFIPTNEMLESSYSKFWNVYFTLYGLEDFGSIIDSLVPQNKK